MPITPKRMPEAELERLGDLLERRAVAHGGMDLELLDGFLSALALAPEREPPAAEEWFAHLWGKTEPRWESAADRADAVGLAEALLGDLLARFGHGGDDPQGPMPMASMAAELSMRKVGWWTANWGRNRMSSSHSVGLSWCSWPLPSSIFIERAPWSWSMVKPA